MSQYCGRRSYPTHGRLLVYRLPTKFYKFNLSLPQCCGAGAATFRAAPKPEPIFLLVGAGSRSRTVRIRQIDADPLDPDPQHWFTVRVITTIRQPSWFRLWLSLWTLLQVERNRWVWVEAGQLGAVWSKLHSSPRLPESRNLPLSSGQELDKLLPVPGNRVMTFGTEWWPMLQARNLPPSGRLKSSL